MQPPLEAFSLWGRADPAPLAGRLQSLCRGLGVGAGDRGLEDSLLLLPIHEAVAGQGQNSKRGSGKAVLAPQRGRLVSSPPCQAPLDGGTLSLGPACGASTLGAPRVGRAPLCSRQSQHLANADVG